MKKTIIVLIGLFVITSLPLASAITLDSGTIIDPPDSNTTYTLGNDLSFSDVVIQDVAPYLNDSIFQIEPDSGTASVVINSLTSFVVTATDDVVFTLGGFSANEHYDIEVDGAVWYVDTANATGVLSFTYTSWSEHTFSIVSHTSSTNGGGGGGTRPSDEPPPVTNGNGDYPFPILIFIVACVAGFLLWSYYRKNQ